MLTDGYFTNNPNVDLLCLVLQLVDSRVGLTRDDEMMVDFLNQSGIPYAVIATKVDKLNKTEREKNLAAIANHPLLKLGTPVIPFSSLKGEGKNEVWKVICTHADLPTPN
jgi:GTP-binding protein